LRQNLIVVNTTTTLKGIITLIFCSLSIGLFAQTGKIAGRITSAKRAENVAGANVSIEGTDRRATTDVEGKFIFNNVPAGTYVLVFESMGFQKKAVSEVEVKANDVATMEVLMEEKAKEMTEVVIKATPRRMETVNALLVRQKNLPNISDGISAESIKRSPDKNTSEVLKRVSGATIQENKYVIVRGLADRYNVATLNNAVLPSTEADRKVFAFDIIPSNLVDNIQIFKTAAPDLPGDFSGGVVQVNTQDVPNKNQVSLSAGLTYNTISTGKDFRIGYLGKYDYLGFESGKRRLPAGLPNLRTYTDVDQLIEASKLPNNLFGDRHSGNVWPGQNYQVSWAHKFDRKDGSSIGTILSATYRNNQNIQYSERAEYTVPTEYASARLYDYRDTVYKFTTTLGAMANVAYKKGNTKISFKNLFNRLMEVTDINREGFNNDNIQYVRASSNETNIKTLFSSQLEGEHAVGIRKDKINWNLNFAYTGGEQPDYRISPYAKNLNDLANKDVPFQVVLRDSYRFFSELNDYAYGGNVSYSIPFKWKNGEKNSFKTGASYLYKTRDYEARAFRYKPAIQSQFNSNLLSVQPEFVFDPAYMSREGLVLDEITNNSDRYEGESNTIAGYAMMDNRLGRNVRLVWGLRVENFDYTVNTADFSNPSIELKRSYLDFMPSFNLTYNLNDKSNLRFGGWRSVSRPDFREVANFQFYDFSRNAVIKGNSELERSQNTNLDLRYEIYPTAGEIFSFSLFAKHFDKPIESVIPSGAVATNLIITYANPKSALSYGAELEFRKKLTFFDSKFLQNFTIFGNLAYIRSTVDFAGADISIYEEGRPMQGQSPYIINGGIQYITEDGGFSITGLINRIGHRIALVGFQGYPDIYENGRTVIDFQIAKKVMKEKGELKLNIGDILNQKAVFYQNTGDFTKRAFKDSEDNIWNTFRYGTNISLSFSMNF
jgi:hypothetical protein